MFLWEKHLWESTFLEESALGRVPSFRECTMLRGEHIFEGRALGNITATIDSLILVIIISIAKIGDILYLGNGF